MIEVEEVREEPNEADAARVFLALQKPMETIQQLVIAEEKMMVENGLDIGYKKFYICVYPDEIGIRVGDYYVRHIIQHTVMKLR